LSLLLLNGEKEFEFGRKLLLAVKPIRKVYSSDSAVGVDGHPQGFNIVAAIGSPGEI
jgi:hypothetical protein